MPRTGSSTNLKPTYTSLPSCTSWSLTPCPTHSSSVLQKSGIPIYVVFATNRGRTKPRVRLLAPRQLYVPNHMATLNQSPAISFHKRTPKYLIWFNLAALFAKWYVIVFTVFFTFFRIWHTLVVGTFHI